MKRSKHSETVAAYEDWVGTLPTRPRPRIRTILEHYQVKFDGGVPEATIQSLCPYDVYPFLMDMWTEKFVQWSSVPLFEDPEDPRLERRWRIRDPSRR